LEKIKEKRSLKINEERNKKAKRNFKKNAKKIHGNKYDYSKTVYIKNRENVEIICPVHGSFFQRPDKHLEGHGCPICKSSRGEKLILNVLKKNNIEFEQQKSFDELVFVRKLRLDFYLSSKKIAIEYNGLQHYQQAYIFDDVEYQKKRDEAKKKFCEKNNIKLIIITFYARKEEDIKNIFIKHKII